MCGEHCCGVGAPAAGAAGGGGLGGASVGLDDVEEGKEALVDVGGLPEAVAVGLGVLHSLGAGKVHERQAAEVREGGRRQARLPPIIIISTSC